MITKESHPVGTRFLQNNGWSLLERRVVEWAGPFVKLNTFNAMFNTWHIAMFVTPIKTLDNSPST